MRSSFQKKKIAMNEFNEELEEPPKKHGVTRVDTFGDLNEG
jgi:hypothetical protein